MATLETINELFEKQNATFEEFKKTNEEKLQAKADGKSVADLLEKQDKMHADMEAYADRIDKLEVELSEKKLANTKAELSKEYASFKNYLVTGDKPQNTVRTDQDAQGGLAVPTDLERTIEKLAIENGAMSKICTVISNASPLTEKLVDVGGAGVANTVELQIIDNTDTSSLVKISPVWGKMEAKPLASQEALADMFFNVEEWVKESVGEVMEDQLENHLLTGNGSSGKTKGLLAYDIVQQADGVRDFGKFEFIKTGVAGGFSATSAASGTNPVDNLIDLVASLKEGYINKDVCFLMNGAVKTVIRKFKDAQANFLWEPRMTIGEPDKILGYPVYTSPYMPAIADDALAIAFGNFKRALKILFRGGLYVVRDPYSKKPNVEFSFVKRYGLMLNNSEAIKFLKLAD